MVAKPKWRKILYEDQNVPDNYVDESFLDEMKKNLYIRNYDYWTVAKASGEITQQISSVTLFVVVFIYMSENKLSPEALVATSSSLTIVGYFIKKYLDKMYNTESTNNRTVFDDLKTFIMFMGFSYGFSPILVSLTETVSTDSIYTMTTIMLLANLMFHNYGASAAMVSEALSLSTGIFASVCLASRLHTSRHSFATVTLSLQIFGLWPTFRKNLKDTIPHMQIVLTVILGILASVALLSMSAAAAILFVTGHIFITFVCPAWLIRLQPYKNNIYGPWDEAVIQED